MKLLIVIAGSISCYKMIDVVRELAKKNHQIKIIFTKGALNFLKPEIFLYLGAKEIYTDEDDFNIEKNEGKVLHVELAKWCDKLIIAPCSANTLNKISFGFCDTLATSTFLCMHNKKIILFPAMNTKMLNNEVTQESISRLSKRPHIYVCPTKSGAMVCKDEGEGKLLDIEVIIDAIETINLPQINKKRILITTGASQAPMDPVRYLTNPSSGITGYEIAKKFLNVGHEVHVVAGLNSTNKLNNLLVHPSFTLTKVRTTREFLSKVRIKWDSTDLFISSAALCDFEFSVNPSKIKKSTLQSDISISDAPDVLKEMIQNRSHQKIIGFAAETEINDEILQEKLKRKPVDLLIANKVRSEETDTHAIGFSGNEGFYRIISENNYGEETPLTKIELAEIILKWFENYQECNNEYLAH